MPSNQHDVNSSIRLPTVLAIGFTGHRNLPGEAMSRKLIYDFLAEKQRSTSEILYGVSSVAAGGDLLFAESCIALNIPLRVLLPLPREDFRSDFDPSTWSRAEHAMDHANSIEVIGGDGTRDERYYECGIETVLQSQWQIALWNGEQAQGLGGTEEIVEFARHLGRPVTWIHSETGAIKQYGEKGPMLTGGSSEFHFLNMLPSTGVSLTESSPTALTVAWLAKLDANAIRVAPQVRRLAAMPIVLTALAAFISGSASHMRSPATWVAVGALLGLTATVLPVALRLGKKQALWVRIRTAAEVSRSVLALWHTPARYQIVGPEILPELSRMIVSLNYLKSEAAGTESVSVSQFKEDYLQTRLLDQKDYFLRQSKKAASKARRYRLFAKVLVTTAIVLSAWMFGCHSLLKTNSEFSGGLWLPLVTSAFFQLATIAGALVVVYDCDRRQKRYQELHDSLAAWMIEFRAINTWSPAIKIVSKIERALVVELLEWRSLLQNMKMPRN